MEGYGKVYQKITRNPAITIESKAIYAYLCSIAGGDGMCYPALSTIVKELKITKERYYKHLKYLLDAGVIEKVQVRKGGKFGKTIYHIIT